MSDNSSADIVWMSASELSAALAVGALSVAAIAEAMIERIENVDPEVNAYIVFSPDQIRRDAAALDAKKASGAELGPLFGVPYSLKMFTQKTGTPASGALLARKDLVDDRDTTIVGRLADADGLYLGMTNAPELGFYGGTTNRIYGQTHNPFKLGYSPGGSSGGAAAAVGAGMGPIAEGSDGAGSIRIPASLCGCVGLKPSLGVIPHTLMPTRFETFTFYGPITRTVADAALMLDVMAGFDPQDPLSLPKPATPFAAGLDRSIEGWRVAYSPTLGTGVHVEQEVEQICREAVNAFRELGAVVTDVDVPWPPPEKAMWEAIWIPGFSGEYDFVDWEASRGSVDEKLADFMGEITATTAVDVGRANVFRAQMYDAFTAMMHGYELLVSPTLASATFPVDQFAPTWLKNESVRTQILGWLLTYPFNMITAPAITVPAGFTSDGRPVGLQIAGRLRADADVLAAAAAFERLRPWRHVKPEWPEKS